MTHFCPTRRSTDLKIRGSIVGPLVADPRASVTARPADGKRLICGRGAARRVQENLAQRRKGAKRKRHAKWHSPVRPGPTPCWKIEDLEARAIFFAPLRTCVFALHSSFPPAPGNKSAPPCFAHHRQPARSGK